MNLGLHAWVRICRSGAVTLRQTTGKPAPND